MPPAVNTQVVLPDLFRAMFTGEPPRTGLEEASAEATPEATEAAS